MAKLSDYLKNFFYIIVLLQIAPPIIKSIIKQYTSIVEPQSKVAYLKIEGVLYDSAPLTKHLRNFFKDSEIKAILLKIDCPGSAAGTGEAIANEIAILKKEYPKPILSLAENICASGAYYIAATTDYIICAPSTLVGSIGATMPYQFKVDELLKKYNVHYVQIAAGSYKNSTDPFTPMTPEKQQMLQSITDSSYQHFVEHIAHNRPTLSLDNSKKWADGKIFSGIQARELGLVDELGSHSNAVSKVKELAVIEGDIEWVRPEKDGSIWDILFGGQNSEGLSSTFATLHQLAAVCLELLTKSSTHHDSISL